MEGVLCKKELQGLGRLLCQIFFGKSKRVHKREMTGQYLGISEKLGSRSVYNIFHSPLLLALIDLLGRLLAVNGASVVGCNRYFILIIHIV